MHLGMEDGDSEKDFSVETAGPVRTIKERKKIKPRAFDRGGFQQRPASERKRQIKIIQPQRGEERHCVKRDCRVAPQLCFRM